jgi:hypothetical protein
VIASIGVAVLIFTNLMLLPVLLSYTGVSPGRRSAACGMEAAQRQRQRAWLVALLDRFTSGAGPGHGVAVPRCWPWWAMRVSLQLKIGDLDPGAPELRADSRYNRDNAFHDRATTRPAATCSR